MKENVEIIDSSLYAIFQYGINDSGYALNNKPINLTQKEIQEINSVLKQCIAVYNYERKLQLDSLKRKNPRYTLDIQDFQIDLARYKKQLFPYMNSKGQKVVWVNCLCSVSDESWRKEMISVEDGGNCFFNVRINLSTKTFYRFYVNGEA